MAGKKESVGGRKDDPHAQFLRGKVAVVIGAGDVVGKPIAVLLMRQEATVVSCNKWTPMLPVINKRYVAGVYDLYDGRTLYINRGLGYLMRVRFNVRPEITVFTLQRAG